MSGSGAGGGLLCSCCDGGIEFCLEGVAIWTHDALEGSVGVGGCGE